MYVEGLKVLLAKVTEVVEDLWIERECYRDIILSANRATEDRLKEYAETARNDPRLRAEAKEHFAQTWQKLDEVGKQAAYELHLLEPPPSEKPN